MKTLKVTHAQYRALQSLTRKDMRLLKKYPKVIAESRQLLRACKKVIKRIEAIPEYASRRKRQTAYKRIVVICQKSIDLVEK
jgi:5-bromo-4-chloroindolyl phosphate hydrolysis protein